jgi:hypothetical protein
MTHIAQLTGVSKSTVSRLLKKVGLSRLHVIEPPPPVRRYQRDNPGEMLRLHTISIATVGPIRAAGAERGTCKPVFPRSSKCSATWF